MRGFSRQVEKMTPLPEWCIGRGAGVWRCSEPPHNLGRRPPPDFKCLASLCWVEFSEVFLFLLVGTSGDGCRLSPRHSRLDAVHERLVALLHALRFSTLVPCAAVGCAANRLPLNGVALNGFPWRWHFPLTGFSCVSLLRPPLFFWTFSLSSCMSRSSGRIWRCACCCCPLADRGVLADATHATDPKTTRTAMPATETMPTRTDRRPGGN